MITALLSSLILQVQPIRIESQSAPILILGSDETHLELKEIKDVPVDSDIIFQKTGITVHEVKFGDRSVFVSERVAPLNGYSETIKFLTELRRTTPQNIKFGSPVGKQLADFFKVALPSQSLDAKPEDECFSMFLAVNYSESSGQLKADSGLPITPMFSKDSLKRTRLGKDDLQKHLEKGNPSFPIFPSGLAQQSFVSLPLTNDKLDSKSKVDNLALSGRAINQVAEQVIKLHGQCSAIYDEMLTKFVNEFANGIPLDGKPVKLSQLPEKLAKQIRSSIESAYEQLSPEEFERIQRFFDTDPPLNLEVRLGAFMSYTNVNADGTTGNSSGIAYVFGNPGGEKPRKNPPPN